MFKSVNVDAVVEHVKNIVDNNSCAICDKTGGTRMRYACGHSSCDDCVIVAPDCSVCLTPPENNSNETTADEPYTTRVQNTANLLNIFQNVFHVDVYKRQRISEQLKIEKELFPECIQAPVKYFNKRKSHRDSCSRKSIRLSQFPGEEITSIWDNKMEQPSENVQLWLNKYVRKPFANLNSNDERLRLNSSAIKKQKNVKDTENTPVIGSTRKRSHLKTTSSVVKSTMKKKKCLKKPRAKNNLDINSDIPTYFKMGTNIIASDNDESGIVMDDEDTVIVIDDSQSTNVDKDMAAWLAVQEAEKNLHCDSVPTTISEPREVSHQSQDDNENVIETNNIATKVPFYLKGYLSEQCIDCNGTNNKNETDMAGPDGGKSHDQNMDPSKDVSITVESKSFKAIIKVRSLKDTENRVISKHSVETQTDIRNLMKENVENEQDISFDKNKACESLRQDMSQDDVNIKNGKNNTGEGMNLKVLNRTQNVIIEESDSDEDVGDCVSLEVTAEIHRSCEEIDYGILADIDNLHQHSKRQRRGPRGYTPTSTDSSEKENFNPNRKKKSTSSKKKPMKR